MPRVHLSTRFVTVGYADRTRSSLVRSVFPTNRHLSATCPVVPHLPFLPIALSPPSPPADAKATAAPPAPSRPAPASPPACAGRPARRPGLLTSRHMDLPWPARSRLAPGYPRPACAGRRLHPALPPPSPRNCVPLPVSCSGAGHPDPHPDATSHSCTRPLVSTTSRHSTLLYPASCSA
jgi:hypothetical protein